MLSMKSMASMTSMTNVTSMTSMKRRTSRTNMTSITSMTSMTSVTCKTSMTSRTSMTSVTSMTSMTHIWGDWPAHGGFLDVAAWQSSSPLDQLCGWSESVIYVTEQKFMMEGKKWVSTIMLIRITLRQRHEPSAFQTQRAVFGSAEDLFHFWPTINIATFVVLMLQRMVVEMMMKMVITLTRRTQALQISSPRRSSSPF